MRKLDKRKVKRTSKKICRQTAWKQAGDKCMRGSE